MTCCCGSIGATGIRLCPDHHRYYLGDRELASVSKVISAVYPRKSWDGVDRAVVDNARVRGEAVDRLLAEYATTGNVTVPPGTRIDVIQRFEICQLWWDKNVNGVPVEAQKILYSEADGVAGTPDFVLGDYILDLKNTYQAEISWVLQLGAAVDYGKASTAGILHVSPKVYREGCRLLKYDADDCRQIWRQAVTWWKTIQRLEKT